MTRKFNFSAGPATLPTEVLEIAAKGLVDYNGKGVGIAEMSHRSKDFIQIMDDAVSGVRELLEVPENFEILFLQGGATLQFSMLAMNLLEKKGQYISTGVWSEKAVKEAAAIGEVEVLASSKDDNFTWIPKDFQVDPSADYLHITSNNTVHGTQWKDLPKTGGVPLAIDASSDIFSKKIDFTDVGLLYAGAQKNIGLSGVVLAIIRKDLAEKSVRTLPDWLKYSTHVKAGSMSNTPPTFSVYIVKLVMDWIRSKGGVDAIAKTNEQKASLIYSAIDEGDFYTGTAKAEDRSLMNVTFTLPSDELTADFIKQAEGENMVAMKGYRTVGGIRASIYNAMPLEGAQALASFMKDFAKKNG